MNKILSTNILIFLLSIVACSSKKNVSESNEKNKNVNGIEKSTVNNSDENITPKNNDTPLSPTKPTNGIQMPTGIYITSSAIDAGFSPSIVSNEDIEGIYLRLSWNSIEPEDDKYNWSFIDQQIAQAIQYNKKVVIGIVSGRYTPEWVFGAGVPKLQFSEINHRGKGKKAFSVAVAPPWDSKYQSFILDMQTSLRDHLKAKPGFYDALIMVKFTGMNINTNEMRLPSQDKVTNGKDVTSDAIVIWQSAGYKPSKIISAFSKLMDGTIGIFPDKAISVPYIPDPQSFPAINEQGAECKPYEQTVTEQIINLIGKKYNKQVLVQWNALRSGGKMSKYINMATSQGIAVGFQLAENEFRINASGSDASFDELVKTSIDNKAYYLESWEPALTQCKTATKNAKSKFRKAAGIN